MERSALGKGLSALIPETTAGKEKIQNVPVDRVKPSALQPRTQFKDAQLQELAASIKEKGIIQPILVRQQGNDFELIAGERRFRAAKLLDLKEIPAIIKNVEDGDLLEISLIENIQREELNKMEEARAYHRLHSEFGLTQEDISRRVGKDRSTIANILRLMDLPEKIQRFLEDNVITLGHAKAVLSVVGEAQQAKFCDRVIKKGLSVRQAEQAVRSGGWERRTQRVKDVRDIHLASAEEDLQHRLGTRVKIVKGKKRGKIVIDFYSLEDLNRVLAILNTQA